MPEEIKKRQCISVFIIFLILATSIFSNIFQLIALNHCKSNCACFDFDSEEDNLIESTTPADLLDAGLICPDPFNPPPILSRIVGGLEAVKGNWPWFAHFGGCGGTILTKKTDGTDDLIMTAAHCCGLFSEVKIGFHEDSQDSDEYFVVPIVAYRMHPQYNDDTMSHDFCLVSVPNLIDNASPQVVFEPACLPDGYFEHDKECHVAGLGALASGGSVPDALQEVDVSLMSEQYCVHNSHMQSSQLDNSMFCAGELDNDGNGLTDGGKDSCQGDSGGPLICAKNGVPFLTGVVSWGINCAAEGYPGIYGDVSVVKDWAMSFFASGLPTCKYVDAYHPDVEHDFLNANFFDISESSNSIGLTIPENYGNYQNKTVTINKIGSTKAINLYIDMLDLEPGFDFLYINSKSFSTLDKKLISINETSVQLRFVSDYELDHYQGLKMTVKLEEYECDCDLSFSRSIENARKPKSMMEKNNL